MGLHTRKFSSISSRVSLRSGVLLHGSREVNWDLYLGLESLDGVFELRRRVEFVELFSCLLGLV